MRAPGIAIAIAFALVARTATAQVVSHRFADQPTTGVDIPDTPLAGDQDARAVTYNPGGLPYLQGGELGAAVSLEDPSLADSSGAGFGLYAAGAFGGRLLPRAGIGLALEWL